MDAPPVTAGTLFAVAIGLATGAVLGLVHFATLRWTTDLYLGKGIAYGFGLQILRFAVLGLVLFALARLGAAALLSGALGLLVMRRIVLKRVGGMP
nr:ATP synthase subunit I [Neoroseomonas alba]